MKETIFSINSPLGEPINFYKNVWRGSDSEKTLSIVAGLQGDSLNGISVTSELSKFLSDIEEGHKKDYELIGTVQIFPMINLRAIENGNISWEFDNLNLDMAFPGNEAGDLNEKICGSLIRHTADSTFGIILQAGEKNFYDFPHIQLLDSSRQKRKLAENFDFKIVRTTQNTPPRNLHLANNWEDNEVDAFVISAGIARAMDTKICKLIIEKIKNFMVNTGVIKYNGTIKKNEVSHFKPDNEKVLVSPTAGFFQAEVEAGCELSKGERVGKVKEIYSGKTIGEVKSQDNGLLISLLPHSIVHQNEAIGTILTDKKYFLSWPFS